MRLRSGNIKKCKPACTKNGKVQIRQPRKRMRKTANCHNCDKIMRSGNIKRHMKTCTINRVLAAANKVQIRCSTKKYGKKKLAAAIKLDEQQTLSARKSPRKQKQLLTREQMLTIKNDELRRRLAPIRNWCSLKIGKPYLFKRVVPIIVKNSNSNNDWRLGHYGELACAEEPLINVWLTDAMVKESENLYLEMEDFYLVALGKRISQKNGRQYHAFIIVDGNEFIF